MQTNLTSIGIILIHTWNSSICKIISEIHFWSISNIWPFSLRSSTSSWPPLALRFLNWREKIVNKQLQDVPYSLQCCQMYWFHDEQWKFYVKSICRDGRSSKITIFAFLIVHTFEIYEIWQFLMAIKSKFRSY